MASVSPGRILDQVLYPRLKTGTVYRKSHNESSNVKPKDMPRSRLLADHLQLGGHLQADHLQLGGHLQADGHLHADGDLQADSGSTMQTTPLSIWSKTP